MTYNVVENVSPECFRLTLHGDYSFKNLIDFIDLIKTEATESDQRAVLVDCRDLAGKKMTAAERFQGGQRIAQVRGSRIRLGIVIPGGEVTKMGEIAARHRRAQLLVAESIEVAESWIVV